MIPIPFSSRATRLRRLVIAAAFMMGLNQASALRGDMISAVTGESTIDPLNPRVLSTPLYVSLWFGDPGVHTIISYSITNILPAALPGQSLTFVQDDAFARSVAEAIARYGYFIGYRILLGTIHQTPTTMADPPATIKGSVDLSVTYSVGPPTHEVSAYDLTVWSVPEPASIVSGVIAALGVAAWAIPRRGSRKPSRGWVCKRPWTVRS